MIPSQSPDTSGGSLKEAIKEKIKYFTEILKLIFGMLIATATGTIVLLLRYMTGLANSVETCASVVGIVFGSFLLWLIIGFWDMIVSYIKDIEKL